MLAETSDQNIRLYDIINQYVNCCFGAVRVIAVRVTGEKKISLACTKKSVAGDVVNMSETESTLKWHKFKQHS